MAITAQVKALPKNHPLRRAVVAHHNWDIASLARFAKGSKRMSMAEFSAFSEKWRIARDWALEAGYDMCAIDAAMVGSQ